MATAPGPAVDLIEHAAQIIIDSRKQPYTAPAHWAGALWEAGMLVAPGSALPVAAVPQPAAGVCSNCGSGVLHPVVTGEHIRDDLPPCFGSAAVPQPADREALQERITEAIFEVWLVHSELKTVAAPVQHCEAFADAVLAVLAGEQEQARG